MEGDSRLKRCSGYNTRWVLPLRKPYSVSLLSPFQWQSKPESRSLCGSYGLGLKVHDSPPVGLIFDEGKVAEGNRCGRPRQEGQGSRGRQSVRCLHEEDSEHVSANIFWRSWNKHSPPKWKFTGKINSTSAAVSYTNLTVLHDFSSCSLGLLQSLGFLCSSPKYPSVVIFFHFINFT
ncbi:hypothetical protein HHK36_033501 [Tetracentron sinense]|uniref:Uncharacterized protein n=1 Tax=Tetracentron sinense TaxID=13715 RepID=A0A834Y966_TETSI|nr:hypothetical protein HHK36_033501 [Tetracentron sinense]